MTEDFLEIEKFNKIIYWRNPSNMLHFYSTKMFKVYTIIVALPYFLRAERFGFKTTWPNFYQNIAKMSKNFDEKYISF